MEPKEQLSSSQHNLLLFALLIGTVLVPINSTMISIGLTPIAKELHVHIAAIAWLVTVYLLVMASTQPLAGKLNDILGRKRTFLAGASIFMLAAMGCMVSEKLWVLIVFRGLQALGGAVMTPAASALVRVNMHKEAMNRAFGMMSLVLGLGAAIGPILGATLLSLGSWRWLFGVNVPMMMVCIVAVILVIPESRGQSVAIDWIGAGLLLCGLLGAVFIVTRKVLTGWYAMVAWGIVVLTFIFQQKRTKHPLFPFSFFRDSRFIVGNVSIFLSNFTMYVTILILPIFLKQRYGLSLNQVGVLLLVFSLTMSVSSWLGSRLTTRIEKASTIGMGFVFGFISSLLFWLCLTVWSIDAEWILLGLAIFGGIAAGIGIVSMQTMSLESVPKADAGSASGIYSTFRYTGSILSSVAVALFYHQVDVIFLSMAGLSLCGALLIVTNSFYQRDHHTSAIIHS